MASGTGFSTETFALSKTIVDMPSGKYGGT